MIEESLPGREVQYLMSPVRREARLYYDSPEHARQAAVLALLMPQNGQWHISFIKRPSHPKDKHSGQISFPGGGIETRDESIEDCALRETEEEIGVKRDQIHLLGPLTKLYVYASNNMVHPFVGYIDKEYEFVPQQSEVDEIITVPLSYFLDPTIIKTTDLEIRGYQLKDVPYYDLNGNYDILGIISV